MPRDETPVPPEESSGPGQPIDPQLLKLVELLSNWDAVSTSQTDPEMNLRGIPPVSVETRDACLDHMRRYLNLPPGDPKLDALLLPFFTAALDAVFQVVRPSPPSSEPPVPVIRVVRSKNGEPQSFSAGEGKNVNRGRGGDLWLIMRFLTDNPDRWFTVKEVQIAVDTHVNDLRRPVVRTRLAELRRRFPEAIEAEWVPGTHFRRYRFTGELVDQPQQH